MKIDSFYSQYFFKTYKILKVEKIDNIVVAQFQSFSKTKFTLFGIKEIINTIKKSNFAVKEIKFYALSDGAEVQPGEPVIQIVGKYNDFLFLETIICGILARGSSIATNASKIVKLADKSKVIFMGDRQDHFLLQSFDGKAAYCGGIRLFVTKAAVKELPEKIKPVGTMPHSLIQIFKGDLNAVAKAYAKNLPDEDLFLLVDYHNDAITTALSTLNFCRENSIKVKGIRIDTSSALIDNHLIINNCKLPGINYHLVNEMRKKLDASNFNEIQICVSSGINLAKINELQEHHCKIDYYGVGAAILNINLNFSCDLVKNNDILEAKTGRCFKENKKLKLIKLN